MKLVKTTFGLLTAAVFTLSFASCESCIKCTVTDNTGTLSEEYDPICGSDEETNAVTKICEDYAATSAELQCNCVDE